MKRSHLLSRAAAVLACFLAAAMLWPHRAAAAPSRAEKLARFDAGYAQCEQRFAQMRGQRDKTYAALYRLRDDDTTRGELQRLRQGEEYRVAHRRATRALARQASASDVATRLEQQCRALEREASK